MPSCFDVGVDAEVNLMNWNELPDLAAVALLAGAFASVSRRSHTHISRVWLTGWVMIVLHFVAFLFTNMPGVWGRLAWVVGLDALAWAGTFFMWASVPYRQIKSSRWMLAVLIGANTLYISLISTGAAPAWTLNIAAALFGVLPLAIALSSIRKFNSSLRWVTVLLYCALSIFLLVYQHRPGNGSILALNAILFTAYFGCCIHFWYAYRRATAGAFITIAGFLAWALVFVVVPLMTAFWPTVHIESEVWNLPKLGYYVVAVGMILLLLEDQIEHNRVLAQHDDLTGLANRRLFQFRLENALARARRFGTQAALLVVDLDRFKEVNDSLGHHVGDLALKQVGSILSGRVRRSDTVARTGGDEFSVILEEPTSRGAAELVCHSLMKLLNEPLQLDKHAVRIGASVGIAVFPDDAHDMESLCIAADLRMYDAKHGSAGRGDDALFTGSDSRPAPEAKASIKEDR
ncbi:MAG: diguanylate cyclase [Terracidiphilus sp.]